MKRIRFTQDAIYETEGYQKGPRFEEGSVHDFEDDFANRWLRRNVAVEVEDEETAAEAHAAPVNLSDLTVARLRELAAAEDIDLGDVTLKADIVATIELAREDRAGTAPQD